MSTSLVLADAYFARLHAFIRQPRDEIRALQERRLRRRVAHACRQAPLYRRLLDRAGVRPEAIRTLDDLPALPLVTKRDLLAAGPDGVARDCRRAAVERTSGTTGESLAVHWEVDREALREGSVEPFDGYLLYEWGLPRGARVLRFGVNIPLPGVVRRSGYYRQQRVLVTGDPRQVLDAIERERPDAVRSFPSSLRPAAEEALARGLRLPLALVVLGGEMLDRRTVEAATAAFGTAPVGVYGAAETRRIAWTCRAGRGYHVRDDAVLVEILDDARPVQPGEAGEVVVTSLLNAAMPIIRYPLGDRARRIEEPCPCGVTFSRIEILEGRVGQVVRLPDGGEVSVILVGNPLVDEPAVRQYRLVQEDPMTLRVLIVGDVTASGAERLRRSVEATVPGMRVIVDRVARIPPLASGKHAEFVSLRP